MCQASINFTPKSLRVELKKMVGVEVELKEIMLAPEIARTLHLGKFYSVIGNTNVYPVKYVYVGRVNTCRSGGCTIKHDEKHETESEFFDYFIFFDSIATVQLVKIFNYEATHGHFLFPISIGRTESGHGWFEIALHYQNIQCPLLRLWCVG